VRVFAAHAAIDAGDPRRALKLAAELSQLQAAAPFLPALRARLLPSATP
jgi:hypothetical protein